MIENRPFLKEEGLVSYDTRTYRIDRVLGAGSNAVSYLAHYDTDGGKSVPVLLKELLPRSVQGWERDGKSGRLTVNGKAPAIPDAEKTTFENANRIAADLQNEVQHEQGNSGGLMRYLDSFQQNNTFYTVFGIDSLCTLEDYWRQPRSLDDCLTVLIGVLECLRLFHQRQTLHLDISPDNIIVQDRGNAGISVGLIDYNSAAPIAQIRNGNDFTISKKEGFYPCEIANGDLKSICEKTDLYAVTAVFYSLLTGSRLTRMDRLFGLTDESAEKLRCALSQESAPVRARVEDLLRDGLCSDVCYRFPSATDDPQAEDLCGKYIDALLKIRELRDHKGVTPETLWENAAGIAKQEALPDDNMRPGETKELLGEMKETLLGQKNVFLTGPSGCGKSVLLRRLCADAAEAYQADSPIFFYCSLRHAALRADWIKDRLIRGLSPAPAGNQGEPPDARAELLRLLQDGLALVVVLDGYSDNAPDVGALQAEIFDMIKECGGVRWVISSRDTAAPRIAGLTMKTLTVPELSPEEIDAFLTKQRLALPPDNAPVRQLLYAPEALRLYVRAARGNPDAAQCGDLPSLLDAYLESLLREEIGTEGPEKDLQELKRFLMSGLLPLLAVRMRSHGGRLTKEQLTKILTTVSGQLNDDRFAEIWPMFAGEAAQQIRVAVPTPDALLGAVDVYLVSHWRLLRSENGFYETAGSAVTDYLAELGRRSAQTSTLEKRKEQAEDLGDALLSAITVASSVVLIWQQITDKIKSSKEYKKQKTLSEEFLKKAENAADEAEQLELLRQALRALPDPSEGSDVIKKFRRAKLLRELEAPDSAPPSAGSGDGGITVLYQLSADARTTLRGLRQEEAEKVRWTYRFRDIRGDHLREFSVEGDDDREIFRSVSADAGLTRFLWLEDGNANLYDIRNDYLRTFRTADEDNTAYCAVGLDADGNNLIAAAENGAIWYWRDVAGGTPTPIQLPYVYSDKRKKQPITKWSSVGVNGDLLYAASLEPAKLFLFRFNPQKNKVEQWMSYRCVAPLFWPETVSSSFRRGDVMLLDGYDGNSLCVELHKGEIILNPPAPHLMYASGHFFWNQENNVHTAALEKKNKIGNVFYYSQLHSVMTIAETAGDGSGLFTGVFLSESGVTCGLFDATLDAVCQFPYPVSYVNGRIYRMDPSLPEDAPVPSAAWLSAEELKQSCC